MSLGDLMDKQLTFGCNVLRLLFNLYKTWTSSGGSCINFPPTHPDSVEPSFIAHYRISYKSQLVAENTAAQAPNGRVDSLPKRHRDAVRKQASCTMGPARCDAPFAGCKVHRVTFVLFIVTPECEFVFYWSEIKGQSRELGIWTSKFTGQKKINHDFYHREQCGIFFKKMQ